MRAVFAIVLVALVASSQGKVMNPIDFSRIRDPGLKGINRPDGINGLLDKLKQGGLNTVHKNMDFGRKMITDFMVSKRLLKNPLFGIEKRGLTFLDHLNNLKSKLMDAVEKAKALGGGVFSGAVDKLKELVAKFHKAVGTKADASDANQEVDEVVAEHHTMQRRIIQGLIDTGKQLFGGFFDKLKNLAGNLAGSVKAKLSELASGVLQKGAEVLAKTGLIGKRAVLSLGDHLKNLGKTLAPLFSPFKDIVSKLGQTLKGHFSNIVETVKGHVSALGDKLKGHVSDLATHGSKLIEHGKTAVEALGEVANDVLKQTFTNAKPHIDAFMKTLGDGAKVVAGHVAGTN